MQYDDAKQTNVFTGNVTLTKGTILIRADRIVVRQDAQGFQYGSAFGKPVSFRQKRDLPEQYVEGFGSQVDYDGREEVVRIQQGAQLRKLERNRVTEEIHGNLIVYDSRTEFFTVDGGAASPPGNPGGRVRAVIQPRAPRHLQCPAARRPCP
jgi:lipopolysaccharide export system protein LptA